MTKRKWGSKKVSPDARERARRENERQRALKKDAADALAEAQERSKKHAMFEELGGLDELEVQKVLRDEHAPPRQSLSSRPRWSACAPVWSGRAKSRERS